MSSEVTRVLSRECCHKIFSDVSTPLSEIMFENSKIYGHSNVRQMSDKSAVLQNLYEMMPEHLGFYGVGSQFSLRWFFQHALAWKGHVQNRFSSP
jgi:hypothetical protein